MSFVRVGSLASEIYRLIVRQIQLDEFDTDRWKHGWIDDGEEHEMKKNCQGEEGEKAVLQKPATEIMAL